VAHHLNVGVGGDAADLVADVQVAESHHRLGAAGGGAVGDADASGLEDRVAQEAGVRERSFRRERGHERHRRHAAPHLAVVVDGHSVGRDARAEPCLEPLVLVQLRQVLHARVPRLEFRADALPVMTEGRESAHAGDGDAAHLQSIPPLTENTWRVM
jgi:hypothetical protein